MDYEIIDLPTLSWSHRPQKQVVTATGRVVGVMVYRTPPERETQPVTPGCISMYDHWVKVFKTAEPFWHDGGYRCQSATPEECAALMVKRWEKRNKGKPARVIPEREIA